MENTPSELAGSESSPESSARGAAAKADPGCPEAPSPPAAAPRSLVRLALIFYGLMFAVAWVWSLWRGLPLLFASGDAAERGVNWLVDPALGVVTAVAVIWLSSEFTERTRSGRALARALGRVLGPLRWRQCLLLAAASGLGEEALFRGALQPHIGLVAASLIFGVAHFVPRRDMLPWTLFSIGAGFLLGGLFEWTGNLVAPVVAHAGINAVNLRLLGKRYAGP